MAVARYRPLVVYNDTAEWSAVHITTLTPCYDLRSKTRTHLTRKQAFEMITCFTLENCFSLSYSYKSNVSVVGDCSSLVYSQLVLKLIRYKGATGIGRSQKLPTDGLNQNRIIMSVNGVIVEMLIKINGEGLCGVCTDDFFTWKQGRK